MAAVIAAGGIVVRRGGRPIVNDVAFRAGSGKITAILGANGAGKSSLLRVLGGGKADEGWVKFGGRPLADWAPGEIARARAVVAQSSALNFPFKVLEVVLQGRAPHWKGRETREDEEAAIRAIEAVDLARAVDRDYTTLSGGERQRVHLARALAQVGFEGADRCLLLDEPTSSLDLRHQHDVLRIVRHFADSGGCAVVVLHDLNLCARYADKVYLMHYGRVLGSGDTGAVMTPDWLGIAYGITVRRDDVAGGAVFTAI